MKKLFKFILSYYGYEDYCCPKCGTHSSECTSNDNYGFICSNCGTEFGTPDV